MTLATRCISCGTTFRVVQDQLRASDGWVRCGRCDTVFDALEGLIDLDLPDASQPARTIARQPRIDPPAAHAASPAVDIQRLLEREDDDARDDPTGFDPSSKRRAPDAALPAGSQGGAQSADPPTPDEPGAIDDTGHSRAAQQPASTDAAASVDRVPAPPVVAPAVIAPPKFIQDADRQARRSSPAMRAALLGSSLILAIMLIMQVVHHQRDAIAAHSPLAAQWLRSACERWNCRIEPLRRIGDLSIESSALAKVAGKPQSVRLTMTLRNRSAIDLAMPAVELSLTDAQGKLIARRALLPADFQIDPPVVAGSAALPLQLVLSTGESRLAGYTVELFYP